MKSSKDPVVEHKGNGRHVGVFLAVAWFVLSHLSRPAITRHCPAFVRQSSGRHHGT
jgi:hypothetical protein